MVLVRCDNCKRELQSSDFTRPRQIKDVASHLIVNYKCGGCAWQHRVILTVEEWEEIQYGHPHAPAPSPRFTRSTTPLAVTLAQLDLEYVNNIEDIQNIWKAQKSNPIMEGVFCECSDCDRKYNAAR